MEAATIQRFQYSSWTDLRNFEGKPNGYLRYTQRIKEDKRFRVVALALDKRRDHRLRSVSDKNSSGSNKKHESFDMILIVSILMTRRFVSSIFFNFVALLDTGSLLHSSFDEEHILKASLNTLLLLHQEIRHQEMG